jgi:hypothetical protein
MIPCNFTQTQRELLNNVKQAVQLVDKELRRIREQRIAICLSGIEVDGQRANEANKWGPMVGANTDFHVTLKEATGHWPTSLVW